ncbi:uncharacterized protein PAC_15158 [Phialocephala subalpina]|uniref:Uncharacterized protein n=1 Tax=Phialocephala subalpina TaxID=576137 RepID=A0A1L7XJS0_9HELO|nr:uncharacterized protein PAC_15158 [Phialocephala subalpina]
MDTSLRWTPGKIHQVALGWTALSIATPEIDDEQPQADHAHPSTFAMPREPLGVRLRHQRRLPSISEHFHLPIYPKALSINHDAAAHSKIHQAPLKPKKSKRTEEEDVKLLQMWNEGRSWEYIFAALPGREGTIRVRCSTRFGKRSRTGANCFIDVGAPVSEKVEPSSSGDDDDSSDGDPDFSSEMEILAGPSRAVRARARTSSACWHARKRASLGSRSLARTLAGLGPQYIGSVVWTDKSRVYWASLVSLDRTDFPRPFAAKRKEDSQQCAAPRLAYAFTSDPFSEWLTAFVELREEQDRIIALGPDRVDSELGELQMSKHDVRAMYPDANRSGAAAQLGGSEAYERSPLPQSRVAAEQTGLDCRSTEHNQGRVNVRVGVEARAGGQAEGASGEVDTGRIELDASLHNSLPTSELASAPIESIDTSGPWYDIEGRYIEETAPGLGSHEQHSVPSAPAQAQPQTLPQSS